MAKASKEKRRRQDCMTCHASIRGNYVKHERLCAKQHGAFKGWTYYMMDGVTKTTKNLLPKRHNRGKKENFALDPHGKKKCAYSVAWNIARQGKFTCKRVVRNDGLVYHMMQCIKNGGLDEDDVVILFREALQELENTKC